MRCWCPVVMMLVVGCGWIASASSTPAQLAITMTGPPVTVVDRWSPFCGGTATPDAPARAWRDATGAVHLMAADPRNRALAGPHLHELAPDCGRRFGASGDADPAAFDDLAWIGAIWTDDGREVSALAHVEYQGQRHPGRCALDGYRPCWRNAIVDLVSSDGGRSFARRTPHTAIASLPDAYSATLGAPSGYFSPSNIVGLSDGRRAAFIFAQAAGRQQRGACLLIAEGGVSQPVWHPVGALGPGAQPSWPCRPVAGLDATVTSLVRHRQTGLWIALVAGRRQLPDDAVPRTGIWYLTSPDLLHWSPRRLLAELPVMFAFDCDDAEAVAYPSLIDADSPERNFDTIGDRGELWLVRFAVEPGCRLSRTRDLIRLPVAVGQVAAGAG